MLEEVLDYLNNWFLAPGGIHTGSYAVRGGGITLPFLQNGQYFRVLGSVFNDGLHRYPAEDMTDEEFTGAVWALAVPRSVTLLAAEIEVWQEKNGEAAQSPYQSESFGGYSYTRATDAAGRAVTWRSAFAERLRPYKKLGGFGSHRTAGEGRGPYGPV